MSRLTVQRMEVVVLALQSVSYEPTDVPKRKTPTTRINTDERPNSCNFSLTGISFSVESGQYAALVGPTGSGKTTLLEIIAGLRQPSGGKILLRQEDVTHLLPHQRRLGYVPQDAAVFPTMTVAKNMAFCLSGPQRVRGIDPEERIQELAEALQLTAILDRQAVNLSGGEMQRVALARALASKPDILLLDEPMTSVDVDTKQAIRRLLLSQKGLITVLHVTHQTDELEALADLILEVRQGVVTCRS